MAFDFVATPLAAETPKELEDNLLFAKQVCHTLLRLGITPYAPHLFFTQFLRDDDPTERGQGIHGGLDVMTDARRVWFVLPPWRSALSKGMQAEWANAKKLGKPHALFTSLEDLVTAVTTPGFLAQFTAATTSPETGLPWEKPF